MATIVLMTDLGAGDWFAGELKGAILSLNPAAATIDLTHSVPQGGIADGAFALLASYRSFPEEAIFLAAVDYGRADTRVIAAKTASHTFIAPDNGLLSWVLRREKMADVREVNTEEYLAPSGCATFPARDLLAPLAAALSEWLRFDDCGPITPKYAKLDWPEPRIDKGRVSAAIIYIDKFGNAITAVSPRELTDACGKKYVCLIDDERTVKAGSHYGEAPAGSAVAYPGSAGLMEIGVNGSSAAESLGLKVGSEVCFVKK